MTQIEPLHVEVPNRKPAIVPGHLVRRAYHLWREIVAYEISQFGLDPTEYAILSHIGRTPGIAQKYLLRRQSFDRVEGGSIIRRLKGRALVRQSPRWWWEGERKLTLTKRGEHLVAAAAPYDEYAHGRCLAPLTKDEQAEFLRLLTKLVETPHRSRIFRHPP